MVLGIPFLEILLPFFLRLGIAILLCGGSDVVHCVLGVVNKHNCGSVLGACEFRWDWFVCYIRSIHSCG